MATDYMAIEWRTNLTDANGNVATFDQTFSEQPPPVPSVGDLVALNRDELLHDGQNHRWMMFRVIRKVYTFDIDDRHKNNETMVVVELYYPATVNVEEALKALGNPTDQC